MRVKQSVNDTITIGDQPDEADLSALKEEGYSGVINLRQEGEPEQPLGPAQEGDFVDQLGLDYLHVGVGASPLSDAEVLAFCAFLDEHAGGKTMVHCRKSGRAAALVALYFGRMQGWDSAAVTVEANKLGLKVEGELKNRVETYLRAYKASAEA